jgi:pimeloyl-ACP methyl ester carboxylesterase
MPKLLVTGDEIDVKGVLEETYKLMPEPKQYVFINQKKHGTEMLNTDDQLRDTLVEFLEGIRIDLKLDQDAQVSGNEGGDQETAEVDVRRDNIEAAYEDRVIRGTLLGDGEVAVILAPMFELTRSSWMSFAKELAATGYTALAFDYPGFGTSDGNFDWNKLDKDTAAVIDYLVERGYEKIVCIGGSSSAYGCLGAAYLRSEIAGLVLISDGISDPTKTENAGLLMPKLLVYGDEDAEVTDIMDALYAGFPDPKLLVVLPEKSHGTNLLSESDELQPILMEFLEGLR